MSLPLLEAGSNNSRTLHDLGKGAHSAHRRAEPPKQAEISLFCISSRVNKVLEMQIDLLLPTSSSLSLLCACQRTTCQAQWRAPQYEQRR